MSFATSKITSLDNLNSMLAKAQLEKSNLENKLANLIYQRDQMDDQAEEAQVKLLGLQSELDATNASLATMPDGPTKLNTQNRATRLAYAIFQTNNRLARFGGEAMVTNEREQTIHAALSTNADAYIAALQTRKAELEG